MQQSFDRKIIETISDNPNAQFIVSLSGGVDSMVALHLLKRTSDTVTPLNITAIHINHNIDKEDDEWQEFCATQCKLLGVKLIIENVFVNGYGAIDGDARLKRYRAIGKHTTNDTFVITGHHANDSAESLLMALQYGAGLDGLCGIRTIRPFHNGSGLLFRPLLQFSKSDILAFARNNEISWVEDPSNSKPVYVRNRVRIELLPLMTKESGDGVIHRISRTSQICQETLDAMNELIEYNLSSNADWDGNKPNVLPVSALVSAKTAPFVIRYWLRKNGRTMLPSSALINNLINQVLVNYKPHHKPVIKLSGNIEIKRDKNNLYYLSTE